MEKQEACKKISDNKAEIKRLIQDCVEVSTASGVPFVIKIHSVHNEFVPKNAEPVNAEDSYRVYLDETGDKIYNGYISPGGWQSSMC